MRTKFSHTFQTLRSPKQNSLICFTAAGFQAAKHLESHDTVSYQELRISKSTVGTGNWLCSGIHMHCYIYCPAVGWKRYHVSCCLRGLEDGLSLKRKAFWRSPSWACIQCESIVSRSNCSSLLGNAWGIWLMKIEQDLPFANRLWLFLGGNGTSWWWSCLQLRIVSATQTH